MIKQFKTSYSKPESATEYPGIKNIKQRNRVQCNNIPRKRESRQALSASFLSFIRPAAKGSGNSFVKHEKKFDFTGRHIFSSVKNTLQDFKEQAITHMIRIFEADPGPELVYVNNSQADKYNTEYQKPKRKGIDESREGSRLTDIHAWFAGALKKIHLSFALDYELNVDPQLNNKTEKTNVSPRIRQFIPESIDAVLITSIIKVVRDFKTKSGKAARKTKKAIVNIYKSSMVGKLKPSSPQEIKQFMHNQQLE